MELCHPYRVHILLNIFIDRVHTLSYIIPPPSGVLTTNIVTNDEIPERET